jgi:enterochelin esterase-like enzyme
MIVVCPSDGLSGIGSGYLYGPEVAVETWVIDEVVEVVRLQLGRGPESTPLCIGGLSMGGFGALRLGSKYADRVVAVSAHSAMTRFENVLLSNELLPHQSNALTIRDTVTGHRVSMPAIRFDCGSEDELLEANVRLHEDLERAAISHSFEVFAGGHDWAYWSEHVADSLAFFDAAVRATTANGSTS